MPWFAECDIATGNVIQVLSAEQEPANVPNDRIMILVAEDEEPLGHRWTGEAFEPIPPAAVRALPLGDFLSRITLDEHEAFLTLAQTNMRAQAWWSRLMARQVVELDHPELIEGFAWLRQVNHDLIAAAQPGVWASDELADERIAAIRS